MLLTFFIDIDSGDTAARLAFSSGDKGQCYWFPAGLTEAAILNLKGRVVQGMGEIALRIGRRIDRSKPFIEGNIEEVHNLDLITSRQYTKIQSSGGGTD